MLTVKPLSLSETPTGVFVCTAPPGVVPDEAVAVVVEAGAVVEVVRPFLADPAGWQPFRLIHQDADDVPINHLAHPSFTA